MKVLVLGATGGIGREVLRAAAAEHSIVVLVRPSTKARDLKFLEVFEGDARDEAAIAGALAGCEAVINLLGAKVEPFRKVTLFSESSKSLISAMQQPGARWFPIRQADYAVYSRLDLSGQRPPGRYRTKQRS